MKHILIAFGLFIFGFGGMAAHAEQEPVSLVGLELGMSPEDALSALEAAGYAPIDDPYNRRAYTDKFNPTYAEVIEHTRKTGAYTYNINGIEKTALYQTTRSREDTNELVKLTFNGFESGQRLAVVEYTNSSPSLTAEQFQARVAERYGAPGGRTGWSGKPVWSYGELVFDGVKVSDTLTMDNRKGLPRRILKLERTVDTASYIARVKALAAEGVTPSETTF